MTPIALAEIHLSRPVTNIGGQACHDSSVNVGHPKWAGAKIWLTDGGVLVTMPSGAQTILALGEIVTAVVPAVTVSAADLCSNAPTTRAPAIVPDAPAPAPKAKPKPPPARKAYRGPPT